MNSQVDSGSAPRVESLSRVSRSLPHTLNSNFSRVQLDSQGSRHYPHSDKLSSGTGNLQTPMPRTGQSYLQPHPSSSQCMKQSVRKGIAKLIRNRIPAQSTYGVPTYNFHRVVDLESKSACTRVCRRIPTDQSLLARSLVERIFRSPPILQVGSP